MRVVRPPAIRDALEAPTIALIVAICSLVCRQTPCSKVKVTGIVVVIFGPLRAERDAVVVANHIEVRGVCET